MCCGAIFVVLAVVGHVILLDMCLFDRTFVWTSAVMNLNVNHNGFDVALSLR